MFFTDGGANTTHADGVHWSGDSPWSTAPAARVCEPRTTPRRSRTRAAEYTAIYTIGYDLENQTAPSQRCQRPGSSGHQDNDQSAESSQSWGKTPQEALTAMASVPENFYYTADPDDLALLFARVAGDVLTNAARLVDNDLPDLVE